MIYLNVNKFYTMFNEVIYVINRIMKLIINQDSAIQANAIAAVLIHFLHFDAFLSSDPDVKIKNQLYKMKAKATADNIPKVRFTAIWMRARA